MTDTPETDAHQLREHMAYDRLWSDFARRLERQRDAYAETLRLAAQGMFGGFSEHIIRERHPELGNKEALPPTVGSGEGSTKQAP